MSKIVFFSIAAHGHTNPTIEVVRELVSRGNEVIYYSFNEFREKIESAGAKCICIDDYLPKLEEKDESKIGKDLSFLLDMIVNTTLSLDEKVCRELEVFNPDCIVSDSLSYWGKLFAKKLNIPYICSNTSFAFNEHTARLMKPTFKEMISMIFGMGKVNKKINKLKNKGYEIKNFIDIVNNDNFTNTICYTSKVFQPLVETFSDKFYFVGPSIRDNIVNSKNENLSTDKKQIYISLGTVNNKNMSFYKNCINAFKNCDMNVIISVGDSTNIESLGEVPNNICIKNRVNQIEILQSTDVFITHCGMNSVSESLYYEVPMVLFPQQSEQSMVANRVKELGAGVMLEKNTTQNIKNSVFEVLNNTSYKENAKKISKSFKNSGGAKKAADAIENIINEPNKL